MKISLRAVKAYCDDCKRSCWMYKRPNGRFVCRGDYQTRDLTRYLEIPGFHPGCQKEINGTDRRA
jgi:hypothetical protein